MTSIQIILDAIYRALEERGPPVLVALDGPSGAGKSAEWHPFDFVAGERSDGTYSMSPTVVRRDPAPVIILDGAYSARPELADLIDLSILVDAPIAVRQHRMASRDAPVFLAAWHARWDAAEEFYFSRVRPPASFALVVTT